MAGNKEKWCEERKKWEACKNTRIYKSLIVKANRTEMSYSDHTHPTLGHGRDVHWSHPLCATQNRPWEMQPQWLSAPWELTKMVATWDSLVPLLESAPPHKCRNLNMLTCPRPMPNGTIYKSHISFNSLTCKKILFVFEHCQNSSLFPVKYMRIRTAF